MQLYKRPTRARPVTSLQRLIRGYQLITTALEAELRSNTVISDDEREEVVSNAAATLALLTDVLSRTTQTVMAETTDLHRLKDSELLGKFAGCQQDLFYCVDIATTMLERLVTFGYLTEKEHRSLTRYWRSIVRQHSILQAKYQLASNT